MTATIQPLPATLDLQARVADLAAAANAVVLERDVEVSCVVNALLTRAHVFFLGVPGVAKTFLSRTIVGLIGGLGPEGYFQCQLGRDADPAVLVGPNDPQAFKRGLWTRNTANRIPRATVAHISEIWNANTMTLDYLLPILLEREFDNGGPVPDDVPLATMLCDSNFTPEDNAQLQGLWDRITFRLLFRPIQGKGNFETMLRAAVARRAATGSTSDPHVTPVIAWADLERAQAEVRTVTVPGAVYGQLNLLRDQLAKEGVFPSDRRFADCTAVVQATAWRAGRDVATLRDVTPLTHVLWGRQADIPKVRRLVWGLVSPLDQEALKINDEVDKLAGQVALIQRAEEGTVRTRQAIETRRKLDKAAQELVALRDQATADGTRVEMFSPLSARIMGLSRSIMGILPKRQS